MTSRQIKIDSADFGDFNGYLALPPTGSGPAILLIQEIFGVNDHIRAVADQYALDGFVVLAPDVFWRGEAGLNLGYDESGFKKGLGLMQAMDFPQAVADLVKASQVLKSLPEVTGKSASLGYCMGGFLSYLVAAQGAVDAAVCYYGGGIHGALDQAPKINQPILMHFAEKDGYIPPEAVESVQQAFKGRSNASIHTYPEVDHGFNCWARAMYNQKASALAHGRTLQFLAEHIA